MLSGPVASTPIGRDERTLEFVARHPRLLGIIDGGLALRRPRSVVRQRLLLMAAILEASPDHADRFLPVGSVAVLRLLRRVRGRSGGRARGDRSGPRHVDLSSLPAFIVVGSGNTGAMAAQTLVEGGATVTMLDVGRTDATYAPLIPDADFVTIRTTDPEQHRYLLGDAFEGIPSSTVATGAQLTPPRAHVVDLVDRFLPLASETFRPLESLAYGGLGQRLGRRLLRLLRRRADRGWTRSGDDASGLPGWSRTGSGSAVPTTTRRRTRRPASSGSSRRPTWTRRAVACIGAIAASGRRSTPRASISDARPSRSSPRTWATGGRIATGTWTSTTTGIGASIGRGSRSTRSRRILGFGYLDGLLVLRFEEHDGFVAVDCLDVRTGERVEHRARRLVLAAGTLGTARIVLRSQGRAGDALPLLCNPYSYVPCLQPSLVGAKQRPERMSLAQLSIFHDPDGTNSDVAMGSIYSYRSLMLFRILPQAPIAMADARILMRYLLPAITIVGIHHPERPGPGRAADAGVASAASPTGDRLAAEYVLTTAETKRDRRAGADLHPGPALARGLGDQADPAGDGLEHPLRRDAAVRGRRTPVLARSLTVAWRAPRPSRVADGSGFRFLPAKGLTLSLMANAHLVAPREPSVVADRPVVVITGANGFIGQRLVAGFDDGGWAVRALVHRMPASPRPGVTYAEWRLTETATPSLVGAAAPDPCGLRPLRRPRCEPAQRRGERSAGRRRRGRRAVGRLTFVSSMSARDGAPSQYGRDKFEIAAAVRWSGRPRRPAGAGPRGWRVVRSLRAFVTRRRIVPLVGGGHQRFQTVHVDDLVAAMVAAASRELTGTLTIAEREPVEFRVLLAELARLLERPSAVRAGAVRAGGGGDAGGARRSVSGCRCRRTTSPGCAGWRPTMSTTTCAGSGSRSATIGRRCGRSSREADVPLRDWLAEPGFAPVDVDSPELIDVHREILASKPMMRSVFQDMYDMCMRLDERHFRGDGLRVEVGAGVSFMREVYPDVLATDIKPSSYVQQVVDALDMPFEDGSVRAIYGMNCFHHFPDPDRFFTELERVLGPGGGCVLVDPYHGPFARWLYPRLFATEGYDLHQADWTADPDTGVMTGANQALSYVVFVTGRERLARDASGARAGRHAAHDELSALPAERRPQLPAAAAVGGDRAAPLGGARRAALRPALRAPPGHRPAEARRRRPPDGPQRSPGSLASPTVVTMSTLPSISANRRDRTLRIVPIVIDRRPKIASEHRDGVRRDEQDLAGTVRRPVDEAGQDEPQDAGDPEEGHRPVVAEEQQDRPRDPGAVADDAQVRGRCLRSRPDLVRDLADPIAPLRGLDRQLDLDLEVARRQRQALDQEAAEGAIARQDVRDPDRQRRAKDPREDDVAEVVDRVRARPAAHRPRTDDHVRLAVEDRLDERVDGVGRELVVAVGEDVDVGLDVAERGPDGEALAHARLAQDAGARRGATSTVLSVEPLSTTQIAASGSSRWKSATTIPTVSSSLRHGIRTATRCSAMFVGTNEG